MGNKKVHISVVIPLLNEEDNIPMLYITLSEVLERISSDYEIIFVDDGSKDQSFSRIAEICRQNERVLGIALSKNFGHQIALTAGMEHSSGELVITMDADMQHPPEVIHDLYKKYHEGFDIVNTVRTETVDRVFNEAKGRPLYYVKEYTSDKNKV
jgi:glycosyltransferase involved in cell wall biosynthesis